MKYSDIKLSIEEQFKETNRIVPMILGRPGGGKTALAKEIATAFKFDQAVLFFASLRDPTDLLGTPNNNGEVTKWVPPEELHSLSKGRNLLILDEVSDAPVPMQNALCGLIHERKVNRLELSPETYIICTGNRTEDKSGANRLVSKFSNRVRFFNFEENIDDWSAWALQAGINPVLIQFLRFRPNLLSDFDPNRMCNPTPRSWERVNSIPQRLPTGVFYSNVAGEVGEGAAAEYTGFMKIYTELDNVDDILKNPAKHRVPKDPAVLYALVGALAHAATKENFGSVCTYIERIPPEFAVMCVNDSLKLKPELKNTKELVQFCIKHSNLLIN